MLKSVSRRYFGRRHPDYMGKEDGGKGESNIEDRQVTKSTEVGKRRVSIHTRISQYSPLFSEG